MAVVIPKECCQAYKDVSRESSAYHAFYTYFQISVHNVILVKIQECIQYLVCNNQCLKFWNRGKKVSLRKI